MQGSYEEQLKFYRTRIIQRIQGYADDIGPTYRLYVDSVLACDDLEQLKEMAELDLQLEYFEYIRKINSELKVFGVSLDDIQRKNNADNESNQESYGIDSIGQVSESDIDLSGVGSDYDEEYDTDESGDDEEDYDTDSDDNEEIRASEADSLLQMLGNFREEADDTDEYAASGYDEEDYGIDDLAQIEEFTGEEDEDTDEYDTDGVADDTADGVADDEDDTSIFGEIDDDIEDEDDSEYEDESDDSDIESEDDSEMDFLSDFAENLKNLENNSGSGQLDEFGNEINENDIDDNDSIFGEIDESYDEYDEDSDEELEETDSSSEDEDNDEFGIFGEIDDSEGDSDEEDDSEETEDTDTDDFNVFGEIDDSDVYDGEDIEEDEYKVNDNDSIFGEIDDDDVYDGEDIDEEELEDNDSIFGEIDDSDYVDDDEEDEESEDVGDILDKQMKQYESGEITDDDDAGYFGDLDSSDNERSSTGFVKGSIMDQYAAKNGIVAFQDKKVNDVYNGMAKVMLRGADMASEGLKRKFGKFFDLKH